MLFFRRFKPIDYNAIIAVLENGDPEQIKKLLWHPEGTQINYLSVAIEMVQKLRTGNKLSIHQTTKKGNFELVIFSRDITGTNFYPLIFDRRSGKIIGVMQAFNEASEHLSTRDKQSIDQLAHEWVGFTTQKKSQ
jgi:hypothetical protein